MLILTVLHLFRCINQTDDKAQRKQQPNQVKKKQIEPWDPRTHHSKELSLGPSSHAIRGLDF